ncbi:MAG: glycosyltransferase family 2 protein, partial [Acidobacteriota bacterium]
MTIIILSLSILVLFITLANVLFWPRVTDSLERVPGAVSVLIPARNEEANLVDCLSRVVAQGAVVGEILVYDDHSTDNTAALIEAAQAADPRIRLVPTRQLEPGWTGKNFACSRLAEASRSPYILFLDADARLQPGAIDNILHEMRRRRLELLSCWPGLITETFWERVLMPMLNFVVFSIYPGPLSLFFSYPSLALAHGACMMFDRRSYMAIGGHSAVRDQ